MKNSRRRFLRNTSIAGTSLAFLSIKQKQQSKQIIGCASGNESNSLSSTISSVRSGNWSDPSVWNKGIVPDISDTPLIAQNHTVTFDAANATVSGLSVDGSLVFSNSQSVTLQSNKNVIVNGLLKMYPNSFAVTHILRFVNVDESIFIGGGMDPLDSDVGLWIMGAGKLDINGTEKKSWTKINTGDAKAGDKSITVKNAAGWQIGDEIMIVPTDKPPLYTQNWEDATGTLTDSYLPKFERRNIQAIDGNTITLSSALTYDHLGVNSTISSEKIGTSTRNWTAEVANLTRNVRIEGTKDVYTGNGLEWQTNHRAHIFINSTSAQKIAYLQARYLGPRKLQGGSRPVSIIGRYAIHFHHCNDGSAGSVVTGCALFEIGAKCYVPHLSNGITMVHNVAFDALNEAFWYDFQAPTHDCIWNGNLMAAIRLDGASNGSIGMELGQGDGNVAKGNVAVFCGCGPIHTGASYHWSADNEGVWVFKGNLAHSSNSGVSVWQNTGNNHTVFNYNSYNCEEGISHGAYGNTYYYRNGHHYNSKIFNMASAGNTACLAYQKIFMDGANQLPYCLEIVDSPSSSNLNASNKIINCVFRNYTKDAVEMASPTPDNSPEKQLKCVDMIECDFDKGDGYAFVENDLYSLKNGSTLRVQSLSGNCYQTVRVNGSDVTSGISKFAPSVWGGGMGLTANYYNGCNFDSIAFTRIDSMLMFGQWSIDVNSSPNGVNHLITGNAFSIRWTGKIEAQFSELYTFYLQGSAGFRLWIDGKQLIDSWYDKADNAQIVTSSSINLIAGQQYDIKIELMNMANGRGCLFYWKCPSLPVMSNVPWSQLYTDDAAVSKVSKEDESADDMLQDSLLDVTVYPNPSVSNFKIRFSSPSNTSISFNIYTHGGVQKATYQNIQNNSTITVGGSLPRGSYYAIATQDGKTKMIKLIKM